MFAKALIDRTLLVFYQWQKSNCRIVIWFISFLTFFASAAQQMSLWRGICYDTVSVKLILINFKVHVFIWWLPGETLNWGWLGLFFCWLNIVVWKQRSRSDEQAPPVLPNTVSFLKKSHSVPRHSLRRTWGSLAKMITGGWFCPARAWPLMRLGVRSYQKQENSRELLRISLPPFQGLAVFLSFLSQNNCCPTSVWYFIHSAPCESRDDAGRIFFFFAGKKPVDRAGSHLAQFTKRTGSGYEFQRESYVFLIGKMRQACTQVERCWNALCSIRNII